jgi:hypothetical protein
VAAFVIVGGAGAAFVIRRRKRREHLNYFELPSEKTQSFVVTTLQESSGYSSSSGTSSRSKNSSALTDVLCSWEIDLQEVTIFHPPLSQGGYGVVSK